MTCLVAHQELGHVKSQILDKVESMLGQQSHATQAGLWVHRGIGDTLADRTQGDQHRLAAVMSYKTIQGGRRQEEREG